MERRRFPRFGSDEHAFIVFDAGKPRIGELVDIGPDGLACRYLAEGDENIGATRTIDLMMGAADFYLASLPVVVVDDREGESLPFTSTKSRIAALQFDELSQEQRALLEDFLARHTVPAGP